jgi:hypothetical protein
MHRNFAVHYFGQVAKTTIIRVFLYLMGIGA